MLKGKECFIEEEEVGGSIYHLRKELCSKAHAQRKGDKKVVKFIVISHEKAYTWKGNVF